MNSSVTVISQNIAGFHGKLLIWLNLKWSYHIVTKVTKW